MDGSHAIEPNQKGRRPLPGGKESSRVGNWNWNLVTREYSWSDEMYQIFNLKPQYSPLRTGTFLNCIHPDDKQKVVGALGKALVGEQSYNIDHRIVWPDGEVRFIHGEATVTFNKVGTPILMLGTVQDITVLKQGK
jgi:PAS domain-containing protein